MVEEHKYTYIRPHANTRTHTQVSNKLVTIWSILFSFSIVYCYFTCLKDHETGRQNLQKTENIGYILLKNVQ